MEIPVIRNVLEANGKLAASLKDQFAKHGILALNLISSPGAGKTSLLERTLTDLASEFRMAVIEGDLQTDNDARRVAATRAAAATSTLWKGSQSRPFLVASGIRLTGSVP